MTKPFLSLELLEDRRLLSTMLIRDINPEAPSGTPNQLVNANGTLFFSATDGQSGFELWKSDGTEKGTTLVRDINPGAGSSRPRQLTAVGNRVFFTANEDEKRPYRELWTSDGTEEGTSFVASFEPGEPACLLVDTFTAFNEALYFRMGWYRSGSFCEKGPSFLDFTLWTSDGTPEGTGPIATVTNLTDLEVVGTTLFFDGVDRASRQEQLWLSDGTAKGTALVTELGAAARSLPFSLTNVNGTLFFRAQGALWKSDGTAEGTVRLLGEPILGNLTAVLDTLFFTARTSDAGLELWRSDGTEEGTYVVRDINPGLASGNPRFLTNVDGVLFFVADDGEHGAELWRSDGTEELTALVQDVREGKAGAFGANDQRSLLSANGLLWFAANDGIYGRELWVSDGGADGTFLVADINPDSASAFGPGTPFLTELNGLICFAATDGQWGVELWAAAPDFGPSPGGAPGPHGDGRVVEIVAWLLEGERRKLNPRS